MNAIPLADLKAQANVSTSASDDELQEMLDAAESWVERYLNIRLGATSQTYTVASYSRTLVLPAMYVGSIATVTDPTGAVVTDYTSNLEAGLLYLPYARGGTWTVTVAFPGTVPADIRLAVLIIAEHFWQTQRAVAPSPLELQDQGVEDEMIQALGYAIPNRAKALLDPLRVPVIA